MRRPSPRILLASIALAGSLAVTGCAPASPELDGAVAAQLEQTVLAVSNSVAEQDWEAADGDLDLLDAQVDAALAAGDLSIERADEIRAAIELVRGDVAAALDAQNEQPEPIVDPEPAEPEPAEPEPDKPGNGNNNGNSNSNSNNNSGNGDKKP